MDADGLPVPMPDRDTQPFWDAAANHRLMVQHCRHCDRWIWQPKPLCPICHGDDATWEEISGEGTVASWIAPQPPLLPALSDVAPFAVVLVDLPESIRMTGMLVEHDGALLRAVPAALKELKIGRPVSLRWRQQRGWTLPCWTLSPNSIN